MSDETREEHNKILIKKEELNLPLWQRIQALASGSAQDRAEAAALILDNYNVIPDEADSIIKELTGPDSPAQVRRRIAERLVSEPRIPWVLHVSLLEVLIKDDDERIVELVRPLWEPYRALSESLRKYAEEQAKLFQNMMPADFVRDLADKAQITIPPHIVESVRRQFSALPSDVMANFQKQMESMPFFKWRQTYLDALLDQRRREASILRTLSSVSPSYYAPEDQPAAAQAPENPLVARLKTILPGRHHWREYQTACRDIFSFCFVPPLSTPLEEFGTREGHHRRDIIYNISMGEEKFWGYVQTAFSAIAVIVDAKNHDKRLPPNEVVVVSKYLSSKKLGDFAVVACRKGPSPATKTQQVDTWLNDAKMIVCASDKDLEEMVALKEAGERPELVLDRLIREIRGSI